MGQFHLATNTGETITAETVGGRGLDPFGRDGLSTGRKVRMVGCLAACCEANRHQPVFPPFTSAVWETARRHWSSPVAVEWMVSGWAAHSANAGLAFGKPPGPRQVYALSGYAARDPVIVAGELHAICGRSEGMSVRGRTMARGTAAFRKGETCALGCPGYSAPAGERAAPPRAAGRSSGAVPAPGGGSSQRLHRADGVRGGGCAAGSTPAGTGRSASVWT